MVQEGNDLRAFQERKHQLSMSADSDRGRLQVVRSGNQRLLLKATFPSLAAHCV